MFFQPPTSNLQPPTSSFEPLAIVTCQTIARISGGGNGKRTRLMTAMRVCCLANRNEAWELDKAPKRPQKLRQLSRRLARLQTLRCLCGANGSDSTRFSSVHPLCSCDVGLSLCLPAISGEQAHRAYVVQQAGDPTFRWVCRYRLPTINPTTFQEAGSSVGKKLLPKPLQSIDAGFQLGGREAASLVRPSEGHQRRASRVKIRADQQEIMARFRRSDSGFADGSEEAKRSHLKIIRQNGPAEPHTASQEITDETRGKCRGQPLRLFESRIADVRGHDGGHAGVDRCAKRLQVRPLHGGPIQRNGREHSVGIPRDGAQPGKMFRAGGDLLRLEASDSCSRQRRDPIRISAIRAIADHRIAAVDEDIDAWGEVDVDAQPPQLSGFHLTLAPDRRDLLRPTLCQRIGKSSYASVEPDDATSFVIHHDEEATFQRFLELLEQLRELFR